ncbi:DUF5667 domain-containing protein [Nocardioides sp. BP30]|uniref:DUF5667 domain-containing protein n=1 Tax=Nocardioides sp. BP30 TaxID=3036374 RepID=UPI0024690896|nr:DUF5667 domain-containing protein [Nocardioides sp. BP30]WGL52912.1 DUF5667 domain-containing protein [Nocardioides sp. BP30]
MSPAFSTRRRAEEFDRLVEAARQGKPASGSASPETAELAAFAASLSDLPPVAPRPSFSADLRERLMAAAATELRSASDVDDRLTVRTNPVTRRRHERRLTVGIASLAIVGASAGTALASQGALPGEPLYPVKRAIENVRTGITPSDNGKGSALLSDARTRLDEVGDLARSSDDSSEITSTLNAFSDQAKRASDLLLSNYADHQDTGSITKLQKFTAQSIDQLTALEPLVPDATKQALTEAAQTVLTIDTAAHNACPACGGSPITQLPESLLTPVSTSLESLNKTLQSQHSSSSTTKSGKPIKLPTVPPSIGPANVDPSAQPSTQTSSKSDPSKKSDPITKVLPANPTSTPTSLGDTVKDVTGGLSGTVDTLLGTVNGLVGGVLGTNKTPAP